MKKNITWGAVLLAAETALAVTLPGLPEGGAYYGALMAACAAAAAGTAFLLIRAGSAALRGFVGRLREEEAARQLQQTNLQESLRERTAELLRAQQESAAREAQFTQELGASVTAMQAQYQQAARYMAQAVQQELAGIRNQQECLLKEMEAGLAAQLEALRAELTRLNGASAAMDQHYTRTLEEIHSTSVEHVQTMSRQLREYSLDLEQRLTGVSNQSTQALSNTCLDAAAKSVQALTQGNEAMLARQSDLYREHLTQTAAAYDAVIASHIKQLAEHTGSLLQLLQEAEQKNLSGFAGQMEDYLRGLQQRLNEHSLENVRLFSSSMNEYRDRFVEANALALSQVQDGTMQSVANANDKVAGLADSLSETNTSLLKLKTLLMEFIRETQTREAKDQEQLDKWNGELNTQFQNFRQDTVRAIRDELEEYTKTLSQLGQHVQSVMEAVQSNTETYRQTLAQIQKSQADMNSLTKEDIKLMKQLLR